MLSSQLPQGLLVLFIFIVDLGGADLNGADLTEAKLAGTDISVAETNGAVLDNIDWGECERKQENTTHHWVLEFGLKKGKQSIKYTD